MKISPWWNNYCQQSPNFFSCCFPSNFDWIKLIIWRLSVTYTRASVIFLMQTWHAYRMVIFRHQTLTPFMGIIERCKQESAKTQPSMGLTDMLWGCHWVQTRPCAWTCPLLFAQSPTFQEVFLKSQAMLPNSDSPHAGAWNGRKMQQHQLLYLTSIHFQKAIYSSLSGRIWNSCDFLFFFNFNFYFQFLFSFFHGICNWKGQTPGTPGSGCPELLPLLAAVPVSC